MSQKNRARLDVRSLLLGLIFGFGTNLITANPEDWWTPLQVIDQYAPVWLVTGISAALLYEGIVRYRENRQRSWHGPDSPYAGLSPYTADRSPVFFGRESEAEKLLSRLNRSGVDPSMRFIPVVGPSGVGKSSLVQAGVLPALNRHWTIIGPLQPGPSPFLALANALVSRDDVSHQRRTQLVVKQARLLRDEAAQLRCTGTGRPDVLLSLLAEQQPKTQRLLIFVDQLEETITLSSPEERGLFLALLRAGMTALPTMHTLATLRPDALAQFCNGPDAPLFAHPFRVGPLDSQRLRDVIMKPAAATGLKIEGQVVEQMLAEATVGDTLPLLSHLLERLHLNCGAEGTITSEAFNRVGRVIGAITDHAEEVYESLLAVYQPKQIDETLLRFVSWSAHEPVRKPVPALDLDSVSLRVVEEFRIARLIVDTDDGASFDLAHDALLRQWDRIRNLIAQAEDRLRNLALLELRAQKWFLSSRPADDLLRGGPLEDARALVAISSAPSILREFLKASQAGEEKAATRKAEEAAERALHLREQDRALAVAAAREAARSASGSSSAVLALWGLIEEPAVERLPIGHSAGVLCFTWLQDSSGIVSLAKDRSVCIWDVHGELSKFSSLPYEGETDLGLAKISADGSRVLLVENDFHSSLWDLQNMHRLGRSNYPMNLRMELMTYEWSPDGQFLAGQPDYSNILVWMVSHKEKGEDVTQQTIPTPHVTALSWSPDQSAIAYLTDSSL
ncbi:NACHT and WD repeat domain-containing protein [Sphaerimonospora cavernae]|uniref:NACHT and WD repeat domain-containing protein n=1 Tax=Sphaerimonospora cavernae TaxID=1740611 RepID=A0ABV6U1P0_9ACTN